MLLQSKLIFLFDEVLNQQARLRKAGTQATYHCPFCSDKNPITQKLEIAIGGSHLGSYHCWRCDTKGRSFGSLLHKLKAPPKYRKELFKLTGDIKLEKKEYFSSKDTEVSLPEEFYPLYQPKNSLEYKNALFYLKKRKILREDIFRYNIGYCESGPYANHIIVPSYDDEGKLNFFIGRRYYKEDRGIPHKKPDVSMNIIGFESFINYNEPLNLVEGVFDAIAVRNNAIPLFGKYLQPKLKTAIILHKVKRVNMILDKDAMKDSIDNYQYLQRLGIDVHIVKLDGKDPSVLGFERIHALIRESKPFEFKDLLEFKMKI